MAKSKRKQSKIGSILAIVGAIIGIIGLIGLFLDGINLSGAALNDTIKVSINGIKLSALAFGANEIKVNAIITILNNSSDPIEMTLSSIDMYASVLVSFILLIVGALISLLRTKTKFAGLLGGIIMLTAGILFFLLIPINDDFAQINQSIDAGEIKGVSTSASLGVGSILSGACGIIGASLTLVSCLFKK